MGRKQGRKRDVSRTQAPHFWDAYMGRVRDAYRTRTWDTGRVRDAYIMTSATKLVPLK